MILDHEGNRLFRIDSAPMLSGGTKYFGVDTSENELFCLYSKGGTSEPEPPPRRALLLTPSAALTPGYAVEFVDHFTGVNRKIDVEGNYTKNVITLSSRGAPIGRIVRSWMRMEMGYGPGTVSPGGQWQRMTCGCSHACSTGSKWPRASTLRCWRQSASASTRWPRRPNSTAETSLCEWYRGTVGRSGTSQAD